ncbi:type I restriction-modification system subunit M [Maritalea mediterranea]|uniref:site-specific DNA-methyltransferase (adenine-specific) n=1 Tax=Maritalea mediterranea TaxID=2909667 RepID=A0ABS9EC81_9HYPH|nr:class I SAM-dependent DNA methyltransferase [Maritalea mediterranea]MCF4099774.1 type I restriction-modification system subunit M [Maritalea mediterranea]
MMSIVETEKRLWKAADQLRANSGLRPSEYSRPVLGLLFLKFADTRFAKVEKRLKPKPGSRIKPGRDEFIAKGAIYLAPQSRFEWLTQLPEDADLGKELNNAMEQIERDNTDLADALPKSFADIPKETLLELLRLLEPLDLSGDSFGQIYEYFMGEFARATMEKGGEFYTPASIVRLIVEIIEPYEGRVYDPACGSGGMFAHSADFVARHQREPNKALSIHGIEKTRETMRLMKMNLAMHGLSGQVREANSYYEDPYDSVGKFDFVMANPPFNVAEIDKAKLKKDVAGKEVVDARFPFGLPKADNGNYLWISLFYGALNDTGRAGFVMANSASDARGSEADIRQKLIETGVVDVIIAVGPNMFTTVTLPCTLWFYDKGKIGTPREDEVLFIDARNMFRQVTRAWRDFEDWQIEALANIVRLWRHDEPELIWGAQEWLKERFDAEDGNRLTYRDVAGLCRAVKRKEIETQGWSLNPGRYVGVAEKEDDGVDFHARLTELQAELEELNTDAARLQDVIAKNVREVLQ